MPQGAAALRIQGASTKTHWTLARDDATPPKPRVPNFSIMQTANGHSFNFASHDTPHHAPAYEGYDSYDGSGYGSPVSSPTDSMQWKPPAAVNGHYNDEYNNYTTTADARTNHAISLNTRVRSPNHDAVGRHLLYETALLDTHDYEILDIDEIDALKKEHERLNSRIEAANRKLTLESKVKDAAQNIQRLYTSKKDSRPDTPQSPESPRKTRSSLLGNRRRTGSNGSQGGQSLEQAKGEVAQSIKKVDELNETIKTLLEKRAQVERKLLRHTAAVLAEQAAQASAASQDKTTNGHHDSDDDGSLYTPNEFDGIRDILHGKPMGRSGNAQKLQQDHEQQLLNMQHRLDNLNAQLRGVITQAAQIRGQPVEPETEYALSEDANENLENAFSKLEGNMQVLENDHQKSGGSYAQDRIEEQLEGLNNQLHNAILVSSDVVDQAVKPPPQITGDGYQHQLQYLEESLFGLENLLHKHNDQLQMAHSASRSIEDAQAKAAAQTQKSAEYETVLAGLWQIMAADQHNTPRASMDDGCRSPHTPLKEDFSLQAFSSRVQHIFDVATTAKEQQDILRRQIQQQRDLNGKSDMEKDREIADWQTRHEELTGSHSAMQDELAKVMVEHRQAEREANESRGELVNVMNEFEQLKRLVDARTNDRDELSRQLESHHAQLDTQLQERDDIAHQLEAEKADLESEIVRLTTELTIAKADLEGAYGTRAQRAKEASVSQGEMETLTAELETLRAKHADLERHQEGLRSEHSESNKLLENELQEMTQEFQAMTRESLEMEKERGQLEGLIDGLRDRVDTLEAQLADEKVRWLGVKSPAGGATTPTMSQHDGGVGPGREAMSVMVLRQEFKRMMREARAEGVRLIRTEQDERRKIEAELRRIRQANGPLGRQQANGMPATISSSRPGTAISASG